MQTSGQHWDYWHLFIYVLHVCVKWLLHTQDSSTDSGNVTRMLRKFLPASVGSSSQGQRAVGPVYGLWDSEQFTQLQLQFLSLKTMIETKICNLYFMIFFSLFKYQLLGCTFHSIKFSFEGRTIDKCIQ